MLEDIDDILLSVIRAYPNNPAARTAITLQAKRLPFFG